MYLLQTPHARVHIQAPSNLILDALTVANEDEDERTLNIEAAQAATQPDQGDLQ